MTNRDQELLPDLRASVPKAPEFDISDQRKTVLQVLIDYVQGKVEKNLAPYLNFICTHNSRRSQFAQIWAQTAAYYYGIPTHCFSGGVELTAFNERAVESMKRSGFCIVSDGGTNPVYQVYYSDAAAPVEAFSKLYNDPSNNSPEFAAIMTCAHADENCPFIPGAEKRIVVRYEDPKEFDGTAQEAGKYDERSLQIATEMFYVFSQIRKSP